MAPIIESANVGRPVADVYAYVTDPTRFSEWQQGVISGRMETGDYDRPDRCITVRKIGFTEQQAAAELVHAERPKTWSVQGIDGPIRARVDVTIEPTGDTTARVKISVDFVGHGIGKLLVPLVVRRQARREMPVNLRNLKSRLESTATTA